MPVCPSASTLPATLQRVAILLVAWVLASLLSPRAAAFLISASVAQEQHWSCAAAPPSPSCCLALLLCAAGGAACCKVVTAAAAAGRLLQASGDSVAVSFYDLWGLWVVLAGGLALGVLLMLAQRTLRRRQHHRLLRALGQGASAQPFPPHCLAQQSIAFPGMAGWQGDFRPSGSHTDRGMQVQEGPPPSVGGSGKRSEGADANEAVTATSLESAGQPVAQAGAWGGAEEAPGTLSKSPRLSALQSVGSVLTGGHQWESGSDRHSHASRRPPPFGSSYRTTSAPQ